MNATFFHGAKLKYDKQTDKYYTAGGLNKEFLTKYLNYFDSVTLITRKEILKEEDKNRVSECNSENIFFHPIENFSMKKLILGKYNSLIQNEVKKSDFCIIRMPNIISIVALHYAIKYKKEYMVELVGCAWDSFWNYGNLQGKLMAPIMYFITKHYIKKAKNVIYVSEEFLQKRYPNAHNHIGCSDVNLWYIDEKVLQKRLHKIEDMSEQGKYKLGLIGSLNVNYKGHKQAIEALAKLNNPNIELHFLGAGKKERWEQLAKKYHVEKQIFFDGILPGGEKVYEWFDSLDIYLAPSLAEGLSRSLIEALSRACPVIASKTGGNPELVGNQCIYGRKQAKKLAKKIQEVLYNKEKLSNMAKNNFEKSLNFDKEKLRVKKDTFMRDMLNIH